MRPSHTIHIITCCLVLAGCDARGGLSLFDDTDGIYVPSEFRAMSGLSADDFSAALENPVKIDHIAAHYLEPDTRRATLEFFTTLTGSADVAAAVLDASVERDVPPALAFALAYEESGYEPRAYNKNADSIDRGLFQLNSRSFPSLSLEEFYDITTNARYGIAHLAFCLEQGGNEVAALAVYNAGLGRVSKGGTPRRTLDYIYRIEGYRGRIDALFEAQVVARNKGPGSLASASPEGVSRKD